MATCNDNHEWWFSWGCDLRSTVQLPYGLVNLRNGHEAGRFKLSRKGSIVHERVERIPHVYLRRSAENGCH